MTVSLAIVLIWTVECLTAVAFHWKNLRGILRFRAALVEFLPQNADERRALRRRNVVYRQDIGHELIKIAVQLIFGSIGLFFLGRLVLTPSVVTTVGSVVIGCAFLLASTLLMFDSMRAARARAELRAIDNEGGD